MVVASTISIFKKYPKTVSNCTIRHVRLSEKLKPFSCVCNMVVAAAGIALSVCIVAVCGHLMQMLSHLPLRAQLVIR